MIERPVKAGSEKMQDTLLLLEYNDTGPISATAVERICQLLSLWTGERRRKEKKRQGCRYGANYRKLAWDTDLHFSQERLAYCLDQ
jgi:hypothetical protein